MRDLKALGPIIVLMISSIMTPGTTLAATFHSSSPSSKTTIAATMTATHHIKTGTWDFTCEATDFASNSEQATTASLTIAPSFGPNCHLILGLTFNAAIFLNSCDYHFYAERTFEIKCPAGNEVEIRTSGCTIRIPAQVIANGLEYGNNIPKSEINITLGAEKVKYHQEGKACVTKTGGDATYSGTSLASGKDTETKKATSIWWE